MPKAIKLFSFTTFILIGLTLPAHSQKIKPDPLNQANAKKRPANSDWYVKPIFRKGDKLANIYSRAIAYTGDAFNDVVQRVSGTSTYTVTGDTWPSYLFNETDLYDGQPASTGSSAAAISGKSTYNGKDFMNTSASGLLYNEQVWGKLPANIREGDNWTVNITQAWELGGPGTQKVSVVQLDRQHHMMMLEREGNSDGFYDGDAQHLPVKTKDGKILKTDIIPGRSHWTGFTIFKNGVVISDELLVTRPITLKTDSISLPGHQREYILLNARPAAGN